MKDLDCPYCEHSFDVCHDDGFGYQECVQHEQECPKCAKTFTFTTSISFNYDTEKADCLNGSPHILKESKTHPKRFAKMRCQTCDHEEALPADVLARYIAEEHKEAA